MSYYCMFVYIQHTYKIRMVKKYFFLTWTFTFLHYFVRLMYEWKVNLFVVRLIEDVDLNEFYRINKLNVNLLKMDFRWTAHYTCKGLTKQYKPHWYAIWLCSTVFVHFVGQCYLLHLNLLLPCFCLQSLHDTC